MIKNPFSNLVGSKETVKTYELFRQQGKSYRFIKNFMNDILKDEHLTSLEWTVLGLLYENRDGLRYIEIADRMGVEPPFVTELVSPLLKLKLLRSRDSETDKRAKVLSLTEKGGRYVESVEKTTGKAFLSRFKDISSGELKTYKEVMDKIISLSEKNN